MARTRSPCGWTGVLNRRTVARHFQADIGEDHLSYARNQDPIAAEAQLDGIYVLRTSVASGDLDGPQAVFSDKALARVERAFRAFNTDLDIRPIRHRTEDRVRARADPRTICLNTIAHHLRRPVPGRRDPLTMTAGNTVNERDPYEVNCSFMWPSWGTVHSVRIANVVPPPVRLKVTSTTWRFARYHNALISLLQRQPRNQVSQMIDGYWVSQICGTVARLGLADHLADGPATISELAAATSADPDGLGRLLRAGTTVGLFAETGTGRFKLTPLGAQLRHDEAAGSLRDRAIALTAPAHWLPWGRLSDAIISGGSQTNAALGMDMWAYYARHPEEGAHFARTMSDISVVASQAVLRYWDVARFRRIVDVGGSRGVLLTGLLDAEPEATGVLFDRPEVVEGARASLAASGHADRVDIVGGDFFEQVPPGGDLYVLKSVLHDWDDEQALQILGNIHRATEPGSTVAVIERLLPSRPGPSNMHLDNLLMLVELKGRERTIEEYASLFERAGFRLQRTSPPTGSALRSPWTVMEAIRQ